MSSVVEIIAVFFPIQNIPTSESYFFLESTASATLWTSLFFLKISSWAVWKTRAFMGCGNFQVEF